MIRAVAAVVIGLGATLCIDLWALFLRRAFGVRSLDYCLLGRWVLHMPSGTLTHVRITDAAPMRGECAAGWTAHYSIGVALAVAFVLASGRWIERPTLLPALAFGVATVIVPFSTLQPAFGLGVASSRAAQPWAARLKSLGTHAVFGLGLYAAALLVHHVAP